MSANEIPAAVLRCWRRLGADLPVGGKRITTGLINDTYRLTAAGNEYILQRLHPVFKAEVNRDTRAVTEHLRLRGMTTQTLVACDDDALWCEHDGRVWRLLSFVPGHTVDAVADQTMAFEAGRMAGRFHAALGDFDYTYRAGRYNVHDTAAHLDRLTAALQDHRDHCHYAAVASLALEIQPTTGRDFAADAAATTALLGQIDRLPLRHCHGDLKISNIVFDADNKAVCLIDLDTVGQMTWPLEMGDALRSWCNPRKEDQLAANLDLELLDAALAGYATAIPSWLTDNEKNNLIAGLARICLELSARFLTDTLRENYFGWDQRTYATRGDHNLARAKAMYALYEDVMQKRAAAENIVKTRLALA